MEDKRPISPHIQIYRWHISSLVSIITRITGVINIAAITLICFWIIVMLKTNLDYYYVQYFLTQYLGKFIILGITWSFSFHILSEIRHLIMDLGYLYDLKTSRITGLIVIFGSIILTIAIYVVGKFL